jgi:hypothetical protein
MVAGINAGLQQEVFGLEPGDNRWAEVKQEFIYYFVFLDLPAIASVRDAGYGELSVHVAVKPTGDAERWIVCGNAGFLVGDGFASGWLERQAGKWLQTSQVGNSSFRLYLLPVLASASVEPNGFADEGPFVL